MQAWFVIIMISLEFSSIYVAIINFVYHPSQCDIYIPNLKVDSSTFLQEFLLNKILHVKAIFQYVFSEENFTRWPKLFSSVSDWF